MFKVKDGIKVGGETFVDSSRNITANNITVTGTTTLPNSGVTAGTYTNSTITVNAAGIVTAASTGAGGGSVSEVPTLRINTNLVLQDTSNTIGTVSAKTNETTTTPGSTVNYYHAQYSTGDTGYENIRRGNYFEYIGMNYQQWHLLEIRSAYGGASPPTVPAGMTTFINQCKTAYGTGSPDMYGVYNSGGSFSFSHNSGNTVNVSFTQMQVVSSYGAEMGIRFLNLTYTPDAGNTMFAGDSSTSADYFYTMYPGTWTIGIGVPPTSTTVTHVDFTGAIPTIPAGSIIYNSSKPSFTLRSPYNTSYNSMLIGDIINSTSGNFTNISSNGNWTVEGWITQSAASTNSMEYALPSVQIQSWSGYGFSQGLQFDVSYNTPTNNQYLNISGGSISFAGTVSTVWTGYRHFAAVKDGSTISFFLDGEYIGQGTDSNTYHLGIVGSISIRGKIKQLKISSNVVYSGTSNFTPSAILTRNANTLYLFSAATPIAVSVGTINYHSGFSWSTTSNGQYITDSGSSYWSIINNIDTVASSSVKFNISSIYTSSLFSTKPSPNRITVSVANGALFGTSDILYYYGTTNAIQFKPLSGSPVKAITYNAETDTLTFDGLPPPVMLGSGSGSSANLYSSNSYHGTNPSGYPWTGISSGIAIGDSSSVTSSIGTAIGQSSQAAYQATSIGPSAISLGNGSLAIGYGANVQSQGERATAIGNNSISYGPGEMTISRGPEGRGWTKYWQYTRTNMTTSGKRYLTFLYYLDLAAASTNTGYVYSSTWFSVMYGAVIFGKCTIGVANKLGTKALIKEIPFTIRRSFNTSTFTATTTTSILTATTHLNVNTGTWTDVNIELTASGSIIYFNAYINRSDSESIFITADWEATVVAKDDY